MENIIEKNGGHTVSVFPPKNKQQGKEVAHYLSNWGFISTLACEFDADDMFSGVSVLKKGIYLIRKVRGAIPEAKTVSNKIEAGLDFKHAHLNVKRSTQQKLSEK